MWLTICLCETWHKLLLEQIFGKNSCETGHSVQSETFTSFKFHLRDLHPQADCLCKAGPLVAGGRVVALGHLSLLDESYDYSIAVNLVGPIGSHSLPFWKKGVSALGPLIACIAMLYLFVPLYLFVSGSVPLQEAYALSTEITDSVNNVL